MSGNYVNWEINEIERERTNEYNSIMQNFVRNESVRKSQNTYVYTYTYIYISL